MSFVLPLLMLAAVQAAEPEPEVPARGLWFGPIQICRDTVDRVSTGADPDTGDQFLYVTFTRDLHARIEAETAARVADTLPVRLDGRIILEPVMNEPIAGGSIQLFSTPEDLPRLRATATGPC